MKTTVAITATALLLWCLFYVLSGQRPTKDETAVMVGLAALGVFGARGLVRWWRGRRVKA